LIILFGGSTYIYYYFFRQVNSKLIETIPTDAVFLYQINDNETFVKSIKTVSKFINPLFGLDAYPGCQFFIDQLPGKYNQVVFSGHENGDKFSILFACKISERSFQPLLSKLQIDPKNCTTFDNCKIYTYGVHLKRFVFTYHQGIFLASENETLLKKAIKQLKNPRNLITAKSFETLFQLTEKNLKQNWLVLNTERYFSHFESYFNENTDSTLRRFSSHAVWAAYQVRFSGMEISLSGYMSITDKFDCYYNSIENKYLYFSSLSKKDEPVAYESDAMLVYAKSVLPSHNDFEMAIHAGHSAYWHHYLSETGMNKFTASQM
jgi:hypothetical protein